MRSADDPYRSKISVGVPPSSHYGTLPITGGADRYEPPRARAARDSDGKEELELLLD
jgi:hypothetical protein